MCEVNADIGMGGVGSGVKVEEERKRKGIYLYCNGMQKRRIVTDGSTFKAKKKHV